jgi:beta-lactamase regulating signal transducer with metallopeptidase domain
VIAEAIEALIRANLAAGAAILLVMALRRPVRSRFGPEVAYWLWLAPILAVAASLLPARSRLTTDPSLHGLVDPVEALLHGRAELVAALWLCGLLVMAAGLGASQLRFLRRARLGLEGPALVGVVYPKLVVPGDYGTRFNPEERGIIRAHERMHVDRGDLLANTAMAVIQNLCWFNPLIHLAARCARQDQELACDAAVMARHPGIRRLYAETLLKTQFAPSSLPLGCRWPAPSRHPLEERIDLLQQPAPAVRRHLAGVVLVLAVGLSAGAGAWMAKPVELVAPVVKAPVEAPLPPMVFVIFRDGRPV